MVMSHKEENNWLWMIVGLIAVSSVVGNVLQWQVSKAHLRDRAKRYEQLEAQYARIETLLTHESQVQTTVEFSNTDDTRR